MPKHPDDLTRLRNAHFTLEDLPDTISLPQHSGRGGDWVMSLEEATIDDIAFAIVAAEHESSAAYARSNSLQRLYRLAREAGGIGTDRAVGAAITRVRR
jgi:hypothetical protein